jgi:hypothetical protein
MQMQGLGLRDVRTVRDEATKPRVYVSDGRPGVVEQIVRMKLPEPEFVPTSIKSGLIVVDDATARYKRECNELYLKERESFFMSGFHERGIKATLVPRGKMY